MKEFNVKRQEVDEKSFCDCPLKLYSLKMCPACFSLFCRIAPKTANIPVHPLQVCARVAPSFTKSTLIVYFCKNWGDLCCLYLSWKWFEQFSRTYTQSLDFTPSCKLVFNLMPTLILLQGVLCVVQSYQSDFLVKPTGVSAPASLYHLCRCRWHPTSCQASVLLTVIYCILEQAIFSAGRNR